ncbi:MAG TPA: hypothetical protein VF283_14135 [Bryobacteraceae bacterium]
MKHGLCARFRVLPELEKQEEFDALLNQLMEDEQPVRFQNQCFALEPKSPEQVKKAEIPVGVDLTYLEYYARYHAAHDRAYQRASAELQKRQKARQLAEIGFASQKRAEAEESRKAAKHAVQIATANLRKQREEMKLGDAIAKMLPPDFDISSLDRAFSAAMSPTSADTKAA